MTMADEQELLLIRLLYVDTCLPFFLEYVEFFTGRLLDDHECRD